MLMPSHAHAISLRAITVVPSQTKSRLAVPPAAYNGAYPLFGCPCFPAGGHVGDIEHITVRCYLSHVPLDGGPAAQRCFYAKHSIIATEDEPAPPQY
jgi:hypothetical protein